MSDLIRAFDDNAQAWDDYTQTPAGRLRELLNWEYLKGHLPAIPATVLDVGAGTGGLGLYLAQEGYETHLLDLSAEMLAIAQQKALAQGVGVTLHHTDLTDFAPPSTGFDVIACHTVLAYVPDAEQALHRIASWLKPGGILSVAFVSRHADVLKAALKQGNWHEAQARLTSASAKADLFGMPRKIYDAETILQFITAADLQPIAEYGVRIFTDYHTHTGWQTTQADFDALFELEVAAAALPPFQRIGRYGQIIATRPYQL